MRRSNRRKRLLREEEAEEGEVVVGERGRENKKREKLRKAWKEGERQRGREENRGG